MEKTDLKVRRKKRPRIFYGWWLLGAGTLALAMQGGIMTYGFAAFFLPLASALGTSRGALSAAFSFTRLESSFLGPVEGFLIDRFGPRSLMYVGFTLWGLSFLLFSRINSVLAFYLIFAIITLGGSMAGFLPVVTAVNNWFSRRRGLATGIASSGVQIGGVLVGVVALAISFYGWRSAAAMLGLIILVAGLPLAAMMRHRPQPYGYHPDGDEPAESGTSPEAEAPSPGATAHGPISPSAAEALDFTAVEALKTMAFWVISGAHGLSLIIIGAVTIHEIPLLVDAGMSYETAAWVLAFMTAVAMVGRVAGGYLGDRFGPKQTLMASFVLMSAGVLVLATAQSVAQAMVFAVLYGLGYGARAPILIALRAEYFGTRNFATIMGFSQPIQVVGAFFGPIVAGVAYDVQGSYRMAFTLIALFNLIGAVIVLFIRRPAPPRRGEAASEARGEG